MKEKYLKQLAKEYRTKEEVKSEILNLKTILMLPKGTEYFLSDLHGEYESFLHLLRSASGVIKDKINLHLGNRLTPDECEELAQIIYYPKERLQGKTKDYYCDHIILIIALANQLARKYTRSHVSKKMPDAYRYLINEMMRFNKRETFMGIIDMLVELDDLENFVVSLCHFVQQVCMDHIHIIGDFFDRGPRPDYIFNALKSYPDVDIQWGNHDVAWMGAGCGNLTLIANVMRVSLSYNNLDLLEDGYGINVRALSDFARDVYKHDPCTCFMPHLFDENRYDQVDRHLIAKMHKAMTILELKLEGQILKRHPEYQYQWSDYLSHLDDYDLKDHNFPTVDPNDPYALTPEESRLMMTLQSSFMHSQQLQRHIKYLYKHGGTYKVHNGNLLYHGCIPMTKDGEFREVVIGGTAYKGKALLDKCEMMARRAYFYHDLDAVDFMWYLWCGQDSPIYGKGPHIVFENYFLNGHFTEKLDPYYDFIEDEAACDRILEEFGATAHIINGHVPVIVKAGERPIKGNGKAFVIDGGLSKAYYEKTGSSGYTLIFDSEHLHLAKHAMFAADIKSGDRSLTPAMECIETYQTIKNEDTDLGEILNGRIKDLEELLASYNLGIMYE
ncbi:MAG: fructose-1,6-bisphosphatase [Erysipelotrichaceae bacterium]|nr:fructose-1,6-bisphosphatase [Erysipelotrichaceae bacterium]